MLSSAGMAVFTRKLNNGEWTLADHNRIVITSPVYVHLGRTLRLIPIRFPVLPRPFPQPFKKCISQMALESRKVSSLFIEAERY